MTSVANILDQLATPRCSAELNKNPWDASEGYGPGASEADTQPTTTPVQGPLPQNLLDASPEDLDTLIADTKAELGDRLTILGHFYQRDEITRHADFLGDSYQLAVQSQTRDRAELIAFCGVHFMAETADILSRPGQAVSLPHLGAGCSMADMANDTQVSECWAQLDTAGLAASTIPLTYMNSSASLKAFCGEHHGAVCTSANARKLLAWALDQGTRVLFFPDEHLGRNTAHQLGLSDDELALWDPAKPLGGLTEAALAQSKVLLWKGYCSVHVRFTSLQVHEARTSQPDVRILVHPECPASVVDLADFVGSTNEILHEVKRTTTPTTFAIGTEINMVNRLAQQFPQHRIACLEPTVCPCSTMYRIHPAYLAHTLRSFAEGTIVNRISVPPHVAASAKIALQRMLDHA